MKKLILLIISFFLGIWVTPAIAQDVQCVVEAQPSYSTSSECKYEPYPYGSNPNFYDSCYQTYLVRKKDWETRCFRYWDEQKTKNSNPTAVPTVNSSVNTQNNESEELKRKLKDTEDKLNILLTQTAQPKPNTKPAIPPRIGLEGSNDFFPYITVTPEEKVLGEGITAIVTPSPTPTATPTPTPVPTLLQRVGQPIINLFTLIFNFFRK